MVRAEVKMVLALAKSLGFEITGGRDRHYRFKRDGLPPVFFSSSPSDSRAHKNSMALLRRLDREASA